MLQPMYLCPIPEVSRIGRHLGGMRNGNPDRAPAESHASTHLSPRSISEFVPGSCFPNWLQGKANTTTPKFFSSSCSAFSSVSGEWIALVAWSGGLPQAVKDDWMYPFIPWINQGLWRERFKITEIKGVEREKKKKKTRAHVSRNASKWLLFFLYSKPCLAILYHPMRTLIFLKKHKHTHTLVALCGGPVWF